MPGYPFRANYTNNRPYENMKAVKADMTAEEKRRFSAEKAEFIETFEKKYGCKPGRRIIRDALADRWPKKYHVNIQALINDDGDDISDRDTGLSIQAPDPFGTDLPDDIACLREVAASLTGHLADIYEALLVRYAGGQERISFSASAKKWGVSCTQIGLDRDRIFRMIREAVEKSKADD